MGENIYKNEIAVAGSESLYSIFGLFQSCYIKDFSQESLFQKSIMQTYTSTKVKDTMFIAALLLVVR